MRVHFHSTWSTQDEREIRSPDSIFPYNFSKNVQVFFAKSLHSDTSSHGSNTHSQLIPYLSGLCFFDAAQLLLSFLVLDISVWPTIVQAHYEYGEHVDGCAHIW
jgi:hypothetical protein